MRVLPMMLVWSLPLLGCTSGERPTILSDAARSITTEDVRSRIGILAHDSMGGRNTPSPGLEMAAAWAAGEFARMGLEPGGDDGNYIQRYEMTLRGADSESAATVAVPNVVGLLRGSDPVLREEWVVFTAHFDHISGPPDDTGDSIYNGADDNASGTAAVLEIAEAFCELQEPPRRSTAFVLVSGEEKGLLGAAHFAKGASLPRDAMVADINADMVSMNSPEGIFVHGAEYTTLGWTLDGVIQEHPEVGLSLLEDQWPQMPLYRMSDQFAFVQEGIPAIFFFSGLHENLHRPSDEPEAVDADKAARVARLMFYFGLEVAQADARPEWTDAGRQMLAELGGH
ncbi:MAG: M20/M25/M40 family metallo-hydrolase [Longimicrobiales bacterium]